ncbi:MAG: MMPL family transporter [Nocardioides sp.]
MATFLYRIGRGAYQHRGKVLAAWLLVLLAMGGLAGAFSKNADAQLSIPGVESVTATELLQERFPQGGVGGAEARMVFAAPDGQVMSDAAVRSSVEQVLAEVAAGAQVAAVSDPFESGAVSPDGSVAYATVAYAVAVDAITETARADLIAASESADSSGLQVELGGEATQAEAHQSAAEAIGVLVALLVLAVTLGSLLAAGLPLLTAMIGVGVGMAGTLALSSVVELTSTAPTLGLMVGLAVGIDYALFISMRHKQNLADGLEPQESVAMAVGTAGSAVVFAGATVMIALGGLAVVGISFLTTMGLVAAAMVGVAVLVALTLVPALLGFAGGRFSRWPIPGMKKRQAKLATTESTGSKWAKVVTKRPAAFLVASVIGLGILAVPALDLELGLPDEGNLNSETTQRQAYDLLAEGFGPGFNGPLTVVIDAAGSANAAEAAALTSTAIANLDNVAQVSPTVLNPEGDTAIVTVFPQTGPSDSETKDLVGDIRDLQGDITDITGAEAYVTGNTALGIDISAKLTGALPLFLLVVVGLSLILLMLAFRSVLVPLKATAGFLLSLAATFGALVAVFQWGWLAELIGVQSTGPIISFLPILLVGLLFGLAMDYEVFLVSRMREDYVHGATPQDSIVGGFRHGARVVTAAALIMAAVFAGFILGDDATIKSIGFALAFGVLVDAFVVRMTIVPAAMALLGHKAWWLPAWLDKAMPDVDIEGAKLERDHPHPPVPRVAEPALQPAS